MEKRGGCFCVFDYMCQQVHAHKCQGDELPVLSHTFSNKPTVTSCVWTEGCSSEQSGYTC